MLQWKTCWQLLLPTLFEVVMCASVTVRQARSDIRWHQCGPCFCNRTYVNCSGRQLTGVPADHLPRTAETIDLASNNISHLPDGVFSNFTALKSLNLSDNQMTQLGKDMFAGVVRLENLSLAENYLLPGNAAYPPGVFRPLNSSLTLLRLEGNCRPEDKRCQNATYPDKALSDLRNLRRLVIDGLTDKRFGPGFAEMTKLQTLHLSGYCNLQNVTNQTFVNLPTALFLLNVSGCGVRFIQADGFGPLRKLHTLDLSGNRDLGFDRLAMAMYGLQGSNLRDLRIDAIVQRYTMSITLTHLHTWHFRNTSIERITARYNELEAFCEGALDNMPKSLAYVDLTGNRFRFGRYLKDLHKLTSLTELVIDGRGLASSIPDDFPPWSSHDQCRYHPPGNADCVQFYSNGFTAVYGNGPSFHSFNPTSTQLSGTFNGTQRNEDLDPRISSWSDLEDKSRYLYRLPPKLKVLGSRYYQLFYRLDLIDIDPNNSLDTLNLDSNLLAQWIGPITGLNLSTLTLSENFAHKVEDDFFQTLTSLKVFNGSKNHLRWRVLQDVNGTLFEPLRNLEVLDLSRNNIERIPRNFFKGLVSLKTLILGTNPIQAFDVNLGHMKNLELLDLQDTGLQYFPQSVMNQLDNIAAVSEHPLFVAIIYSPIACTCQHIDFLTWITDSAKVRFNQSDKYICVTENGTELGLFAMSTLSFITHNLQRSCVDHTWVLVGAVCGAVCLLGVLLSALVYRFRWKLRYLYYATRLKYSRLQAESQDFFQYDAFVSYASEDSSFVHGQLLQRLEQGAGLRLNVHNRDWMPGRPIPSNIVDAVQNSRRTLVVLTKQLLESDWCRYEMQMATMEASYAGRDVLLFLLYEEVSSEDLSREVFYNLQNSTYIQYPHTQPPDERLLAQFWRRLALALRK